MAARSARDLDRGSTLTQTSASCSRNGVEGGVRHRPAGAADPSIGTTSFGFLAPGRTGLRSPVSPRCLSILRERSWRPLQRFSAAEPGCGS